MTQGSMRTSLPPALRTFQVPWPTQVKLTSSFSAMRRNYHAEMAEQEKGSRLSSVRRRAPEVGETAAPDRTPPSAAEHKINQYRKRRYTSLNPMPDAVKKRHADGKPTARERVEMVVDAG